MSTERIVVDERIADTFAQRLADQAIALTAPTRDEGMARFGRIGNSKVPASPIGTWVGS